MEQQALKFINAKKVCTGTRQVVFRAARNIFGSTESLEISLRSRVSGRKFLQTIIKISMPIDKI